MLKSLKRKAWSRLVDICDNRKGETLREWIPHTGLNGVKVHIPPLTKFRPETPCGVKRSHAKNFRNQNCGFPTIKLF